MHDPVLEDKLPFCSHSVHLREGGGGGGEGRERRGEERGRGERDELRNHNKLLVT